jgi:hypothetical protein
MAIGNRAIETSYRLLSLLPMMTVVAVQKEPVISTKGYLVRQRTILLRPGLRVPGIK